MQRRAVDSTGPRIDFADMGIISERPINPLLNVPDDLKVMHYGYFQLSVKEYLRERLENQRLDRYLLALGPDYPLTTDIDSKIDFVIGKLKGIEVVLIDSNNDESFLQENPLHWTSLYNGLRYRVDDQVTFEYWSRGITVTNEVAVSIWKLPNHNNRGKAVYKGSLRERRLGNLRLGDDSYSVALEANGGEFATFDAINYLSLSIDLDNNDTFEPWESIRVANGPFTLSGVNLGIGLHVGGWYDDLATKA
jgi:hypothetical protein